MRDHEHAIRKEVAASEVFDFLDAVSAILSVAIDRAAQDMATASEASIQKTAVLVAAIRV